MYKNKKTLVAYDVDDVLIDFVERLSWKLSKYFGKHVDKSKFYDFEFWNSIDISYENSVKLMSEMYGTLYDAEIIPGSIGGVKFLSSLEMPGIAITARSKELASKVTDYHIQKYFNGFISKIYYSANKVFAQAGSSKSELCAKFGVDIIVEDSLNTAIDCSKTVGIVFLLDKPWNKTSKPLPNNVVRVDDWNGLITYAKTMDLK